MIRPKDTKVRPGNHTRKEEGRKENEAQPNGSLMLNHARVLGHKMDHKMDLELDESRPP